MCVRNSDVVLAKKLLGSSIVDHRDGNLARTDLHKLGRFLFNFIPVETFGFSFLY